MPRVSLAVRFFLIICVATAVATPARPQPGGGSSGGDSGNGNQSSNPLDRDAMIKMFNQGLVDNKDLAAVLAKNPRGQEIIGKIQTQLLANITADHDTFPPNEKFDPQFVKKSSQGVAKLIISALERSEADNMVQGAERDNKVQDAQNWSDKGNKDLNDAAGQNQGGGGGGSGAIKNSASLEVIRAQLPPAADKAATDALIPFENTGHPPIGGTGSNPSFGDITHFQPDPNNAASMVASAQDKIFKGDTSGALADVNKAVNLGGGADALALRGGLELDKEQYSSALADAQNALQKDPTNKDALAVLHQAQGRDDGVASGGPSGKIVPGAGGISGGSGGAGGSSGAGSLGGASSDGARYASGSAAGRLGGAGAGNAGAMGLSRSAPSAATLAAAAGMTGGQAQKAAQAALALKDYGSAMAYVTRALAQNPNDPVSLNIRSQLYAHDKRYAEAAADALAGLAVSPKDSALLRSLGFAQLRDKKFADAIKTANEMLELDPNDAYAYALRGHAYGSLGKRDLMLEDLTRAAQLDPSFKDALAQMTNRLQLPTDADVLFLFPGEDDGAAKTAAPPSGRNLNFGLLVGASALGGLLLALVLLNTVLAPLKEQAASMLTRLTRTGPTVTPGFEEEETSQPSSVNGLMPGLIRGQYEISRQIGSGGMGLVFEGLDRSLGRRVAIKKMRDELRYDQREKARFVVEAKTVAALHHPNIVDIYAIAEAGDDVFLIFEYVEGKTVHELVQSQGRLEPNSAAAITRASAEALEYAHSRGVVHRDMKPSNVMIDGQGRVKVMDFGIARTAKDALTRFSMTNTVVGTPPYMAPEQEQGHVRRESDVYALAVCAYEMLTGNLPFAGIAGGMLLNKINMSFTPPSRETAGLPPALDPVFERAFQADPDKRYRSAREFAAALDGALSAAVRA